MSSRLKIAILISGSGSNLQAIIDSIRYNNIPCDIQLVVSNQALAYGLTRAKQANLKTMIIDHKEYTDRQTFDQQIARAVRNSGAQWIVLAGFMRIFSDWFVESFKNKMINIHPALLPAYKGLNTHRRALDENATRHGATVHLVTPELDDGPNILQGSIDVHSDETEQSLTARVHHVEHRIYPQVIQWLASGRLVITDNAIILDQKTIPKNGRVIHYADI